MAKTKKSRQRGAARRVAASARPNENRAMEFLTVGWLLSALTTFLCEAIALASGLAARLWPTSGAAGLLSSLMLFSAVVVGAVSVVLLGIVWLGRTQSPPLSLVVASIAIALIAPVLMSLRAARLL
jgi:hypothetical protein